MLTRSCSPIFNISRVGSGSSGVRCNIDSAKYDHAVPIREPFVQAFTAFEHRELTFPHLAVAARVGHERKFFHVTHQSPPFVPYA